MVNITLRKTVITITLIQKTEQKIVCEKPNFLNFVIRALDLFILGYNYCQFIWGMGHLLRIDTIMIIIKITRN